MCKRLVCASRSTIPGYTGKAAYSAADAAVSAPAVSSPARSSGWVLTVGLGDMDPKSYLGIFRLNGGTQYISWYIFLQSHTWDVTSTFIKTDIISYDMLKLRLRQMIECFNSNWISLGFGQNKTFKDITSDLEKLGWTFFTIFWHFIDQTINLGNNQQINC